MSFRFHIDKKWLLAALMSLFPLTGMAQDKPSLLVDRLFSDNEEVAKQAYDTLMRTPVPEVLPFLELRYEKLAQSEQIVRLLEVAAPICDATCLPYLASALRHDRREVVIAACHAATELGRNELRPALFDLLERSPDEGVRYAAVRALESVLTEEQYDALLATVQMAQPDAAALRIVRNMPPSRMEYLVSQSVRFAKNASFSTSIIQAWKQAGKADILFDALLASNVADLSSAEQEQAELALVRLAPSVNAMTPQRKASLLALPEHYTEDIIQKALILAPFEAFFPEIMRLVRTMPDVFTPDVAANIIMRFPVQSVEALTELLQHDVAISGGFSVKRLTDFSHPDAATLAFMTRLKDANNAATIALRATHAKNDTIVRLAVIALEKYTSQDSVRARLFALLGHHRVAEDAAMILPGDDLASFILENPKDDTMGARYYARWALARHVLHGNTASPELLQDAQEIITHPRLHALPAMALLMAANVPIREDAAQGSYTARRLQLMASCRAHTASNEDLQDALKNTSLKAQAYLCMIEDSELLGAFSFDEAVLAADIQAADMQVALRAMIVTQKLAQNHVSLSPLIRTALTSKLYDEDERIVHNALSALRAMHALPAKDTLMTLYHRARQRETREFLALLADIPTNMNDQTPKEQNTSSWDENTRFLDQAFDIIDRRDILTRFGFY